MIEYIHICFNCNQVWRSFNKREYKQCYHCDTIDKLCDKLKNWNSNENRIIIYNKT